MIFTQVTFLYAFLPISIIIYLAAYRLSKMDLTVCNAVLVCLSMIFIWWAEPKLLWFIIPVAITIFLIGKAISAESSYIDETDTNEQENNNVARSVSDRRNVTIFSFVLLFLIPVLVIYLPGMGLISREGAPIDIQFFSGILSTACLSFFTLNAISYIADIYRGEAEPGNILDVFTYILLFPKVICGPVVLWRDFKPQLGNRESTTEDISSGLERVIVGLAKKAILADTFYSQILLIDAKMSGVGLDVPTVWLRALLLGLRLYCDISAYSDIAVGLMRIFGFDVCENFNYPALSVSITDFWRRWHISLNRWFREYVYIPLQSITAGYRADMYEFDNKVAVDNNDDNAEDFNIDIGSTKISTLSFNLSIIIMITCLLAALWHGWRLTILLWGLINGALIIIDKLMCRLEWYRRIPRVIKISCTLLLTCLGWMLFMSPDIETAGILFRNLFISSAMWDPPNFTWEFFLTKRITVFIVITLIGAFGGFRKAAEFFKSKTNDVVYSIISKVLCIVLLILSLMFVMGTSTVPFVYQTIF